MTIATVVGFIIGVLIGAAIWSAAEYLTTWMDNR